MSTAAGPMFAAFFFAAGTMMIVIRCTGFVAPHYGPRAGTAAAFPAPMVS